ncbi:dihydrofolate reductase [Haloarcula nitratireducens]|uniref:dihydrofolate reductase n=1 Tax=Haloarcula nitratireducens TaxID=2487749 RepID=A0AAW4PJW5_9EURY|nr:dihydrofolate reductase [Halomicroarcula nitratireducens]MBX0297746.1 dihydrofolate reductase [Halomicroarcula nitratireducens]
MELSLVAAVAANGVIGAGGSVPWHYPEDLEHFKRTTVGHPVIVGRQTFETIARELGGPLPERHNVVLTHRPESLPDSVVGVESRSDALAAARSTGAATAYVVGGGSVYRQFLSDADELVLTELDAAYEGDTTFPSVDWSQWRAVDRDRRDAFEIVTYARRTR